MTPSTTRRRFLQQAAGVAVARSFEPLSGSERAALVARVEEVSGDGRFELFKTTTTFDSGTHRSQHGFPSRQRG